MQDIGLPEAAAGRGSRRLRLAFALLGATCALVPALAMWGFTVDDALIAVRYAQHLAGGAGYRFDAAGPSTDGVTPLPWAFLLAPLAARDALAVLGIAKGIGVAAWTGAGAVMGGRIGEELAGRGGRARGRAGAAVGALVVMGVAFPVGAWAASGMETGLATALASVAATRLSVRRPAWQAALIAGLAATLRPELVVWAVAIAIGAVAIAWPGVEARRRAGTAALALLLAAGPFLLCAIVRLAVFGRPAPLAVLAKPSDLSHGLVYAGAGLLVVLTPLLVLAPVALRRARGVPLAIVLAFVVHALVVIAVGGDWMPFARLFVPVVPSLALASVLLVPHVRPAFAYARVVAALVLGVLFARQAAPAGRGVAADRADLVRRARPVLEGAKVVAALDIGWVSAAAPDAARIVDLAGLTDPQIALLPGGHTSKRVDVAMLLDRDVDTVLVYSELRAVELRFLRSELFTSRFVARERLSLGMRGAFYTVYRRHPREAPYAAPAP